MANLTAYQEFLLGGKLGESVTTPSTPRSTPQRSDGTNSNTGSGKKKHGKNEMMVFKAFQMRLQEWNDMDNQLELVLGSISNLRDRIWWETKHLEELRQARPWKAWSLRSFQSTSSSSSRYTTCLNLDDVHLALTNDLLQHERMLSTGRTLMASMAQVQDGMGRKLDEWMMMSLEGGVLSDQGYDSLEKAQGLYVYLAQELHRKQILVKQVLDSCHDGLVDMEARDILGNPSAVSRQCCAQWRSKEIEMSGLMKAMLDL